MLVDGLTPTTKVFFLVLFILVVFLTEECNWPITLSYYWSQLQCEGISVYLKRLCKVRVGNDYLFGNCSLYNAKCLLMDWFPPPRFFCSFWWFLYLRTLVLDQCEEPAFHYVFATYLYSIRPYQGIVKVLWHCWADWESLHLFGLWFNSTSGEDVS